MKVIWDCWIFLTVIYNISFFSANTQVALPSQCISYTTNTDSTRNVAYTGCCYCESISGGWYRFLGAAGTRLSTFPSNTGTCGYNYPSWLNASLPTTRGAVTSGNICFNNGGNICTTYSSANIALVTNCGDYYVFFLPALSVCGYRYCTTWIIFNNYRKKNFIFLFYLR